MSTIMNSAIKTLNFKEVSFDPFQGPKLLKVIPTTESQLEIWLSCIIGGDDANRSYNESISLTLSGKLDKDAIIYSLEELVKRHEILHATFSPDGKSICIYEESPLALDYQDISHLNQEEREHHISAIQQLDSEKVFDFQKSPLFRSYLVKLSENEHFLKISAHHIVCDGWSFGIILENISKIYSAKVNNTTPALDSPIQFSQYSKEELAYLKSEEYQEAENYWIEQYKDEVPVLNIPTDNPRPTTRTFKSHRLDFKINKDLINDIKNLGAKSGASLVSTLIASFETYLHLLTKQSTIVLGLPSAGQSATGNYELVGHCVNMLPLRSRPSGTMPFIEYLSKRKSEILDDYDHQQFTFGTLLKKLSVARDSSRIPLIPVVFNIDMGMDANVAFAGLEYTLSNDPRSFENFEIFLNITGTEQTLTFEWSYNTQLFKSATIERMMNEYEALLEAVVLNPQIKIKDIPTQSIHSIKQLNEWNNTYTEYPKNKIVTDYINEAAIKDPNKTAIYFEEIELSYTQLNQRSNQLANYLLDSGIKRGDIIGLAVDRSPEMVISLLAIIKSGAAYLPLDPQYPKGRIEFMLEDSSAKHLIIAEKYSSSFSTQANAIIIEEILPKLNEYSNHYPSLKIQGEDLAYILYTSGSTGKPKGVQIEHHSLSNLLLSIKRKPGITHQDKLLAITTISFDIAGTELFLPLIAGASIQLVDSETAKDGRDLLQIVQEKGISIMQATPTTWRMMLAAGWSEKLPLKIICTGEAFPKDLAEALLDKGTEIWNGYGPSETTIWSSVKQITKDDDLITIGKPIDNTQIYILNENQKPLPEGTAGEIYIAGDGLARNYLNRPELTSEKFVHNPFSENKTKMYRTGDLGYYLESGEIVCLGRIDAQVKIRGHRIELGEIEYSLSQQGGIKEAVVISQGDDSENQSLLAYIVPDENDSSGWKDRWDDLYTLGIKSEEGKSLEEQNLDIAIISQYNNEEDIKEHGIEWTQEGLKRIRALNAKKILELGTGGGHLLFELAPETDKYIATDYSEVAISKLNEKLASNSEKWKHVKAFKAAADDFKDIDEKDFDLIFFHGVVQYFPSLDYLVKVLEQSVRAIKDGGCIHIADAQTLSGISMHFANEQLKLTSNDTTVKDFKSIVQYRVKKEEEISIDPGFFYFLPQIIPEITAVDVQIRKGDYSNEATKCHYDIWLYKGLNTPKAVSADISENWQADSSLNSIEATLSGNPNKVIQIKSIPNKRVHEDYAIAHLMEQLSDETPVTELKRQLKLVNPSGINPTQLWELGDRLGFKTHVRWANDASDGKVEVVFIPNEYKDRIPDMPSQLEIKSDKEYFVINDEAINILEIPEHQIQIWKNALKDQLPDYMVPVAFIALNHLPVTSNGKIDRKNLPITNRSHSLNLETSFVAPRDETEELIFNIWSKLLSLETISINNNFFELGGHSLIAVRVMLSLEKETGIRLPISTLFENSTIEKLAQTLKSSIASISSHEDKINEPEILEEVTTLTVPAIHPQTEIWVACMLGEEQASKSYNISFSEHFSGILNRKAMEKALQELVNRHQSLRSTFSIDGTEMLINSHQKVDYSFKDISDLHDEEQQFFLEELATSNADTPFDLVNGPLFKTSLIKLGEEKHFLTITFHHIICDGSSSSTLMKELSILYNAYSKGLDHDLENAPLFSDYALKQQNFYRSSEYKQIEDFWVGQFKEEVPVLDIPTDFIRPERRTYKGARVKYPINDETSSKFKKVGFDHGCSSAIAIRAALEIFLYRITGQETIVSGLPIAGQLTEDKDNLVGHCVNLIPLKTRINTDLTFIDYLNKRKNDIFQAYDNHNLTFSSLLNRLNITRDTSRVPLTPVLLNIQSDPYDNSFHGLVNEGSFNRKLYETFEISINVDDLPTGMSFRWDYNIGLYKPETIEYFHNQFENILNQINTNPNIRLEDILLLDRGQSSTINTFIAQLKEWNNTRVDYPKDIPVHQLINEVSIKHPDKTAIVSKGQTLSYFELNRQSNQLANYLIKEGVGKGDIVGLIIDRSTEMVISLLAIMKSGAAYLPLDPQYPKDRIEFMLEDSSTKFLLCSKKYNSHNIDKTRALIIEEIWPILHSFSDKFPFVSNNGSDLAYILYTSGSTGQPKGVQIENHSLLNFLLSIKREPGISADDTLLAVTTISFDIAGLELLAPLISGAKIILASDKAMKDGRKLVDLIEIHKVTVMQATPVTWYMLLESGWTKEFSLKVLCGGEAFPKNLLKRLINQGNEVWNMYGPTETTIWSSVKRLTDIDDKVTIGTPIANTQMYILDEFQKPVEINKHGEIYIAGDGLSRGYLNRPELTKEKFISNSFSDVDDAKMYGTGDIGYYLENGEIVCLGRIDDQVKIRGFRIELGEIEYNLSKQPEIKEAIVISNGKSLGNQYLIAYIKLNDFGVLGLKDSTDEKGEQIKLLPIPEKLIESWRKELKKVVPDYMIPSVFIAINYFPTTNNGKIDKKQIPIPDLTITSTDETFITPRNEKEKILSKIWIDQLGVSQLSVNKNFFEAGGNSLMAIRVMLNIEKEIGIKLPIGTLFESPTIEELAKLLSGEKEVSKWHSLVPIKTIGSKTPIYLVHGGGFNVLTFEPFSKFMDPEQPIYTLQGLGLGDNTQLPSTIEEIANFYISEVLENDPIGPYALGGYCSGGIIAYEMSRQLIELGKKVSLLAMFDTYCGDFSNDDLKKNSFEKISFYTKTLLKFPRKTLSHFKSKMYRDVPIFQQDSEVSTYGSEVNARYMNAIQNYKVKPINIKIDLFKAEERVFFLDEPDYYGWQGFALKGVNVHCMRGNHTTFITSPNEKNFASVLQNVLDNS